MISSMNAISSKAPASSGNMAGKGEKDSYVLAAADSLLEKTEQRQKWQQIRQNNDTLARKLAPFVMERSALLNKAAAGKKINWDTFNTLTAKLAIDGIYLWDKKALYASGWPSGKKTGESASSKSLSMPTVNSQASQTGNLDDTVKTLPSPIIHQFYEQNDQKQNSPENGTDKKNAAANIETGVQKKQQPSERTEDTESEIKPSPPAAVSISGLDESPLPAGEIDLLVLDARWERYTLASGFSAYGNRDQLFMPLGSLAAVLQVPLQVDPRSRSAKGEVQGKNLDLDLNKNTLILGNETIKLPENACLVDEDDIYVDTEYLKDWLPLDFDYSFRNMTVELKTREKFPFEESIARQQRWGKLSLPRTGTGPSVLEEKTKPAFISAPVGDLSISATHDSRAYKQTKGSYTLSGAGNLFGATSYFYATGDDEHYLNRIQARVEKTDIEGNLPFDATRIALGDVVSLGEGGTEQGFVLDTRPIYRNRDFDTTRFEGNLEPGWEVELYRGSTLLDVYKVEEDGHYVFEDVDVYYGNNPFRLVFYGPEGQKRQEDRSLDVGDELLPENSLHYATSITRQNTTTYSYNQAETEDTGNIRAVGLMEYGLGPKTTLFGGFTTETDDGERRYKVNAGLDQNLDWASLHFEGVQDIGDSDNSINASLQTSLGDTRIKASHTINNRLDTDEIINTSEASISGNLGNKEKIHLPYTLSANYTDSENSYSSRFRLLNSLKTGPVYWNHSIERNYDSSDENPETIDGRLNAYSSIKGVGLRAYANYSYDDEDNGFTDAGISASRMLRPGLMAQASLNKSLGDEDVTRMDAQLNWQYKDFTITPKVSGDDDGNWGASINLKLNTSFGMEPHKKVVKTMPKLASYQGHASVMVFEDENRNGIFDETEKGLEDVKVKALQSGKTAETDKDGIAMLSLFPHMKTDIVIDDATIDDPALSPAGPGEAVTPKPGDIRALTFPVIRTGEIDGTLYGFNAAGESVGLKQVEVLLKNEAGEVVDRVLSEFDGFYLFEKVPPGNYTVEAAWTGDKGQEIRKSMGVNVDDTGSIASGSDLVMTEKEEETLGVATKTTSEHGVEKTQATKEKEFALSTDDRGANVDDTGSIASGSDLVMTEKKEETLGIATKTTSEYGGEKTQATKEKEFTRSTNDRNDTQGEEIRVPQKKAEPAGKVETKFVSAVAAPIDSIEPIDETARPIQIEKIGAKTDSQPLGRQKFGVHLSSYRTAQKAADGIKYLMERHKDILQDTDFTIKKLKVSEEKGIWFRVMAGSFDSDEKANQLVKKIKMSSPYCKVMSIKTSEHASAAKGVHLTSFRTREKALQSIKTLKQRYPDLLSELDFSIKTVDFGPEKGKWKRVIAGRFESESQARALSDKIKMKRPYCKSMDIERKNEVGIHLASYRTLEKAASGVKQLQEKFGALIGDMNFSVRRTDLGPSKGIWYRIIAGNFKDTESAAPLTMALKQSSQYARMLKF